MTTLNKENAYKLFHKTCGIYITSPYGYRINPITGKKELHEGVDYGTNGLCIPIYPILDGKVLSCGTDITGAKFVYVLFTSIKMVGLYYHLSSINVKKGEIVNTNTILGKTGKSGKATGIHLHFDFFPYKDYKLPIMKRGNIDYNCYKFPVSKPTNESKPISENKPKNEIKVGDSVIVCGFGYATSFGTGAKTRTYINQKMKVISIATSRKYPYALNQFNKGTIHNPHDVTGWFSKESVKQIDK